jgi:hypothetical protein
MCKGWNESNIFFFTQMGWTKIMNENNWNTFCLERNFKPSLNKMKHN